MHKVCQQKFIHIINAHICIRQAKWYNIRLIKIANKAILLQYHSAHCARKRCKEYEFKKNFRTGW
jgi:hypothetical protein